MTLSKVSKISSGKRGKKQMNDSEGDLENKRSQKHHKKEGDGKKRGKSKFYKRVAKKKALFPLLGTTKKKKPKFPKEKEGKIEKRKAFPTTRELRRRKSKELRKSISILDDEITKFMKKAIKRAKKLPKQPKKSKKAKLEEQIVEDHIVDFMIDVMKKDQMITKKVDKKEEKFQQPEIFVEPKEAKKESVEKEEKFQQPEVSVEPKEAKKESAEKEEKFQQPEIFVEPKEAVKEYVETEVTKFERKPIYKEEDITMAKTDLDKMEGVQGAETHPEHIDIKEPVMPIVPEVMKKSIEEERDIIKEAGISKLEDVQLAEIKDKTVDVTEFTRKSMEEEEKITPEEVVTDETGEPTETLPKLEQIKEKREDKTELVKKDIKRSKVSKKPIRKSPTKKEETKPEKSAVSVIISKKDAAKIEKMKKSALKEMEHLKHGLIIEMERWRKLIALQTENIKANIKEEKEKYRNTMQNLKKVSDDIVKDIENLKNDINLHMEKLKKDAQMDVTNYTKQINSDIQNVQNEASLAMEEFIRQSEEIEETKIQLYENLREAAFEFAGIKRVGPEEAISEQLEGIVVKPERKSLKDEGESIWNLDEFWNLILPDKVPVMEEIPEEIEEPIQQEKIKITEYVIDKDVIVADIEYVGEPKKSLEPVLSKEALPPLPEKKDLKDFGKKVILKQRPPRPKPRKAKCIICKKNGSSVVRVCHCPGKLSLAHLECLMEFCHRRKQISCKQCNLPYPLVEGPTLHRIYEELKIQREVPKEATSVICPIWAVITFILVLCNLTTRFYTDKNFAEMNTLQKIVALASVIALIMMSFIVVDAPIFTFWKKKERRVQATRPLENVKTVTTINRKEETSDD